MNHIGRSMLLVGFLVLANCGGGSTCTPGESTACTCADGTAGAKLCQSDGSYGTCVCEYVQPDEGPPVRDAGADSGPDAGPDAGDSGQGVATDAGDSGLGLDSGPDGGDSGADAGLDSGVDAGLDSGVDAGLDSGVDAGLDSGVDSGIDAGADSGVTTYTLTLTIAGSGSGTVTSSPALVNCSSGTCTYTVPAGTSGTLIANPAAGSTFAGWSGACSGIGACSLSATADASVTATFNTAYTLRVVINGSGTVSDGTTGGINCTAVNGTTSGACTVTYSAGTQVSLGETPGAGWGFGGWFNACAGTGSCQLTLNASSIVGATFNGPFAFTVTTPVLAGNYSFVPGESRSLLVAVTMTNGASLPVALSVSNLPNGVTGSFSAPSVTPNGSSVLTLTVASGVALGTYNGLTVTGTSGSTTASTNFNINVRSPYGVNSPTGLALETGGSTLLVSEAGVNGATSDVVRMTVSDRTIRKTIVSELKSPVNDLAIEAGGTTALAATGGGLVRINLVTGFFTVISTSVTQPYGVAIESSGATALVTDCGSAAFCTSGRLVRVDLTNGGVTSLTGSGGFNTPGGVAIEAGGATAVVVEYGASRLLRVTLSNGAVLPLATGLAGPRDLLIESGGAAALVVEATGKGITRVSLATGIKTPATPFADYVTNSDSAFGIVAESGGTTVLVAERAGGRVVQHALDFPVQILAPALLSSTPLYAPMGVALDPSGTAALITDCGPVSFCTSGRLVRADLSTGMITSIASASLNNPIGVAAESGGTTALVAESGNARIDRIDLSSGAITVVASGTALGNPQDLAIESGGNTALVTTGGTGRVQRINLSTGAIANTFTEPGPACGAINSNAGIAIESGGSTALVVHQCGSVLERLNLSTGAFTALASGFNSPVSVTVVPGGTTALVTDTGQSGRLESVLLATGERTVLAPSLGTPQYVAFDSSGLPLGVDSSGNRLFRVSANSFPATSLALAQASPTGVALEAGGGSALVLDCGAGTSCNNGGRLVRVTFSSGAVTSLATGLNTPASVVPEGGGATALVTDCGPSGTNTCASTGRLLRVTLSNGAESVLATGFSFPDGIAIEPGGTSALIAESGAGRLLSVDLTNGSFAVVASGLLTPQQVTLESSGLTALVSTVPPTASPAIQRVLLSSGVATPVTFVSLSSFAVEPSGNTALALLSGTGWSASLARINLTTGAVNLLANGVFDLSNTLVLDATGSGAYFTESRNRTGALYQMPVPP